MFIICYWVLYQCMRCYEIKGVVYSPLEKRNKIQDEKQIKDEKQIYKGPKTSVVIYLFLDLT